MSLTVIGLGVNAGDISVAALEVVKNCQTVILRTENTQSAETLKNFGVSYQTLDYLYEKSKNFDTLTKNICKKIKELLKDGDVCYLVDGAVSEDNSASYLINKIKGVKVFAGVSKVGYAIAKSGLSGGNYSAYSAYSLNAFDKVILPLVIYDLDNVILASEWKLKLFSLVGEDVKVRLYAQNRQFLLPLYKIDEEDVYDYSTVLVIDDIALEKKQRFDYDDLFKIVKILRGEDGCPWDRAQTKKTICRSLIEECYELVDAVEKDSDEKICEEAGDVLLQTAFYANFLEEDASYDKSDVLSGICSKLITRHSHVFGNDVAKNPEDALTVWNKNKQTEKGYEDSTAYLDDVPKNFPAALRAEKVIKRAKYCGYPVGDKASLIKELQAVLKTLLDNDFQEVDLKRLIFTAIALIKSCDKSAEEVISNATRDFIEEFSKVENLIKNDGLVMKKLDEKQVEEYLNEVKKS